MDEDHVSTPPKPTPQEKTLREAWSAARRNPDGTKKRTPMLALVVLLVLSGLLVPLFLLGNSEDLAYSGSTTATQASGGETTSRRSGGSTVYDCRDAPVTFEVDGEDHGGPTLVSGKCLPSGETREISVRYVPDDPDDFTALGRQWVLYGFATAAALGFLVTLVAVVRRVLARGRSARVV